MRKRPGSPESTNDPGPPGVWAEQANCAGQFPALLDWFGKRRVDWALSKQVCTACPVRRECLTYALDARAVHGVWGGLDPLELRYALGRDAGGNLWTYTRTEVKCPWCRGRTDSVELGDDAVQRKCDSCGFSWERAERRKPKRTRRKPSDEAKA